MGKNDEGLTQIDLAAIRRQRNYSITVTSLLLQIEDAVIFKHPERRAALQEKLRAAIAARNAEELRTTAAPKPDHQEPEATRPRLDYDTDPRAHRGGGGPHKHI